MYIADLKQVIYNRVPGMATWLVELVSVAETAWIASTMVQRGLSCLLGSRNCAVSTFLHRVNFGSWLHVKKLGPGF